MSGVQSATKASKQAAEGGARPREDEEGLPEGGARPREDGESLRIGDVAKLLGTTPRTIRYYEEIGLIASSPERASGRHRLYSAEEVERLREVMRFKHLLGISLDQLKELLAAEEARSAVRAQLRRGDVDGRQRRDLLEEALRHIDRQLTLVEGRAAELEKLQSDLCDTRARVQRKLAELDA